MNPEGIPITGVKRVGRRLPGVNIGSLESRYRGGVPLDEQIDSVVRQVDAQPAEPTPDLAGHIPAIGALSGPDGEPSGDWGVFCLRCTGDMQNYVYPCLVDPSDWPPPVLRKAPDQPLKG